MEKEILDNQEAQKLADTAAEMLRRLHSAERYDLLLHAVGVPLLERLRIEAARSKLSRLVITRDFRFLLTDYDKEVILNPVHKALYILFLRHTEGIEFKSLIDHREELLQIYRSMVPNSERERIEETVDRLVNPVDNAVNEKCSRIKAAFSAIMDEYTLTYYAISSHANRQFKGSQRVWFRRIKVINLPRELIEMQFETNNQVFKK